MYNLDFLHVPLTGVGYCTWHMVSSILALYPEIDVIGFRSGRLLEREELLEVLGVLKQLNDTPPGATVKNVEEGDLLKKEAKNWKASIKKVLKPVYSQPIFSRQVAWLRESKAQLEAYRNHRPLTKMSTEYIYHELNFALLNYAGPKVTMIHDVSIFACPEFHPKDRVSFMQKRIKASTELANAFVVSCEHAKQSLIDLFPITKGKVHVIPPAAADDFCVRTPEEVAPTIEKYQLRYQKFILCVATLEPRKNMIRLIKAYAQLPQEMREEYPLVLAGAKGWLYEKLLEEINSKKIVDRIILTGYLPRAELCDLFSSAKLVAYPSLYEGFGSPVLEAMCSGAPILTSNITSMPEVCGDNGAGVLIDPYQIDDISQGIYSVLSDQAYCDQLITAGLERAKDFSWEKFARRHVEEVYPLLAT